MHTYKTDDVVTLVELSTEVLEMDVKERERLIQSGEADYTTLLAREELPSDTMMHLYYSSMDRNGGYVKGGLKKLASMMLEHHKDNSEIVLVSFLRAALPTGVVLFRMLRSMTDKPVHHYAVSILKKGGVDKVALKVISKRHNCEDVIFFDSWTGKGSVSGELRADIEKFNEKTRTTFPPDLYVLNDISGTAKYSVSSRDFLHPSAILNSTVSGLLSRTVVNKDDQSFHRVKSYRNTAGFLEADDSLHYVDSIEAADASEFDYFHESENIPADPDYFRNYLLSLAKNEDVVWGNIKPGIGEVTRAMLRRVPRKILIKEYIPDLDHIVHMCKSRNVPIVLDSELPLAAVAILENRI